MSDVRFLASQSARGTGIPRTNTQVPQRPAGGDTSSHISASPSAGARAQAQVIAARRPPGMRQDATVTILDRRSTAQPTSAGAQPAGPTGMTDASSQFPTVQIVERRASVTPSGFTVEQMMLVGYLLDKYRENTLAIADAANTALAEGALGVLAGLLQAAGAPTAAPPAPSAPAARARGGRRREASAATADGTRPNGDALSPQVDGQGSSSDTALDGAPSSPESSRSAVPERA
jgi:hypothetical protein